MKTDDLIHALAADHASPRPWTVPQRLWPLASLGTVAAVGLLWSTLGFRADLDVAIFDPRVACKFAAALSLAAAAALIAGRSSRPEVDAKPWPVVGPALAILAVGVGTDLASAPAAAWPALLVGQRPLACLSLIPLFSLVPLLAVLGALRGGAPRNPREAGFASGLLAGGLGAAVWALHCTDDSLLFVAAWYVPAVGFVALLGAALGARLLRW